MKSSSKYRGLIAKRLSFSMAVYYLLISVLIMRLGYIQIVNPEKYTDKAIVQQQKDEIIQPLRGSILDRNGKELAVSIVTYDILVEKIYVQDVQKTAEALSKTLEDVTVEEFKAKYDDDTKRFILRKNIPLELVEEIKQSEATGLKFEENSQRKYPYGQFGSFVIGHVSYDNEGIAGIESYMNNELKGIPGRRIVVKDAENREVPNSEIRYNEARNGNTIVLTIDEVLQHHVEKVTNQAYIDNNAVSVTSIVMNPKNGEILAMASKPDYDPNSPREAKFEVYAKQLEKAQDVDQRSAIISKMWRNPSVNDIYEPGSTFKLITASAALEEDKVFADEVFYDSGYVKIKDRTIKNWTSRPYGSLTFRKAVEESVNTVFVQVANRLGAETFRKYIEAFGYGSKTGIEIPGEAEGIIYPLSKTGEVELATMSFGQSISVTPLQMINSVAAIANEGKLLKPTLIKEIWDYKGNIIHRHEKEEVKASVSPLTASKVMDLMESVVKAGGENSQIDGYRLAGKSGTAQKASNGIYQAGAYIGSYVAVAPVEDPQLVVLTIIDEPRAGSYYGGVVAAPVARDIMSYSLRYLGVNPDNTGGSDSSPKVVIPEIRNMKISEAKEKLSKSGLGYRLSIKEEVSPDTVVSDCFPKPGEKLTKGSDVILYIQQKNSDIKMPDLKGKTMEESDKILTGLGLNPSYTGTGKVHSQAPAAGTRLSPGTVVSLEMKDASEEADTPPSENAEEKAAQENS